MANALKPRRFSNTRKKASLIFEALTAPPIQYSFLFPMTAIERENLHQAAKADLYPFANFLIEDHSSAILLKNSVFDGDRKTLAS